MARTIHPASPLGIELSRRRALQALGLVALTPAALSLAGCAPDGGGGGSDDPLSGTLTFVYMGDADQQKAFKQLFELFNEQYPDIELKAQGIPSGNWATFSNAVATKIAGGAKIDIIQIATEGQRLFSSKKGLLHPLEDLIEQDRKVVDEYWSDCNPNLKTWNTEYASPDGKTYFMPGGFNTMCLYANKDVFAAAGAELPEADWTWDDFVAAGTLIKEKTGAFLVPAASGYFTDVMPWLTTNGASTFDAEWSTPSYDTDAAIESAEFVRGLVEQGLAPEPGGQFDAGVQLQKGELATLGGGRWPTLGMRDLDMVDKVRIVNWPTRAGNGSPVGWDAWPITESSQNKQAAWTFIKFLISKEASEYFATIGGTIVPARNSVANSAAFTDNAPEGSPLLSEAMSFATPIPSPDRGAECQKVIEEAWLSVISGNQKASVALPAANEKLAELVP